MNAVRTWSAAISFAVLAISILQYLTPAGSMEKIFRYLTGAFIVFAMAFSLKSFLPKLPSFFSLEFQYEENTDFSSFVEEQEISAAERSIERLVKTEMEKMKISYKNICVDMDKQEDGRIGITRIQIMLAAGYEGYGSRVSNQLSETLRVPVEVISGEE